MTPSVNSATRFHSSMEIALKMSNKTLMTRPLSNLKKRKSNYLPSIKPKDSNLAMYSCHIG